MTTILDEIVAHKRTEIAVAKRLVSQEKLERTGQERERRPDFLQPIVDDSNVSLIAEVKKASPSKGLIRSDFSAEKIALLYAENGAKCISVLTDEKYFQGHLDYLRSVAAVVDVPLLRKDFIVDPYQVYEAKAAGASAVLLIAECLDKQLLVELHDLIVELEMTPLVEFHDRNNLDVCLDCGARLIGVNNRDLKTFHTDLNHVIELRKQIPDDRTVVAESGIFTRDDVQRIGDANIQAMLVGESLMRQQDVGSAVRQLLGLD